MNEQQRDEYSSNNEFIAIPRHHTFERVARTHANEKWIEGNRTRLKIFPIEATAEEGTIHKELNVNVCMTVARLQQRSNHSLCVRRCASVTPVTTLKNFFLDFHCVR